MAAGNMFGKTFTLAAGATQDLKPSSFGLTDGTNEINIHNYKYDGQIQFSTYDGTTLVTYDSDTGAGARQGMTDHCSGSYWTQLKNTGSGTLHVSVDGMQTA